MNSILASLIRSRRASIASLSTQVEGLEGQIRACQTPGAMAALEDTWKSQSKRLARLRGDLEGLLAEASRQAPLPLVDSVSAPSGSSSSHSAEVSSVAPTVRKAPK